MTEDEAKTKWCPFARAQWVGPEDEHGERSRDAHPSNRMVSADLGVGILASLCLGSACMVWRWREQPRESRDAYTEQRRYEVPQVSGKTHYLFTVPAVTAAVGDGFCGLAGALQ